MADQFDRAQEIEYRDRQINLEEARMPKKQLIATGKCLYCYETLAPDAVNKRFCDIECRDEFDKQEKK